jgi:hypothetical protein
MQTRQRKMNLKIRGWMGEGRRWGISLQTQPGTLCPNTILARASAEEPEPKALMTDPTGLSGEQRPQEVSGKVLEPRPHDS